MFPLGFELTKAFRPNSFLPNCSKLAGCRPTTRRPQRNMNGAQFVFILLRTIAYWRHSFEGVKMYNNFLQCEKCSAELNRQNQKQMVDRQGFTHSYCAECFAALKGAKPQ